MEKCPASLGSYAIAAIRWGYWRGKPPCGTGWTMGRGRSSFARADERHALAAGAIQASLPPSQPLPSVKPWRNESGDIAARPGRGDPGFTPGLAVRTRTALASRKRRSAAADPAPSSNGGAGVGCGCACGEVDRDSDGLFRAWRDCMVEVKDNRSEKESPGSERRWWGWIGGVHFQRMGEGGDASGGVRGEKGMGVGTGPRCGLGSGSRIHPPPASPWAGRGLAGPDPPHPRWTGARGVRPDEEGKLVAMRARKESERGLPDFWAV